MNENTVNARLSRSIKPSALEKVYFQFLIGVGAWSDRHLSMEQSQVSLSVQNNFHCTQISVTHELF